ncbi:NAD(P)H:quinone oxidoreductase [Marinicella gelatinilytica]|uniref:NAD(P)H:quinone oxidoreductase n=1 Tax=Marinicella gelatinilytica TaxID=2996017 RepID=UPI0022609EDD|nr:NAD(P)H:quinone oxidoreductase [Marinicella gelatinilytica]MCX7545072.1 NAD(P)H:quinone oxidoreductase [Marinicella gelatinilytica]
MTDTTTILILYYSKHGNTQKMARLIARGVQQVDDCEAIIRTVASEGVEEMTAADPFITEQELADCDGLLLGSPSHFGNMAAPLKAFIDSTSQLWLNGNLEGKPAGVFANSSSIHGGQETTLINMMIPLLHHGMILAGLPYSEKALLFTETGGSPYGATHWAKSGRQSGLDNNEKQLCLAQGKRIAEIAKKLKSI